MYNKVFVTMSNRPEAEKRKECACVIFKPEILKAHACSIQQEVDVRPSNRERRSFPNIFL